MKPRLFLSLFLKLQVLLLLVSILSCTTSSAAFDKTTLGETILRIHGSNTIGAKLGPDIARRFLKHQGYGNINKVPGAKENEYFIVATRNKRLYNIEINAHGSSTSFRSLEAGLCDVGMASRRIKNKELKKLTFLGDLNDVDNEHVLAIDGIAVIVNRANPIEELSVKTIQKLFTGQAKNWNEVGGADMPVQVYARDNNSGTYDTFKSMVLKKNTPHRQC